MSRKHRSNKRRRSQAFPDEEEHVVEPVPAAEPEEPAPPEVVEVVEVAEPEPEQVNAPAEEQNEEPQLPEESPEELKRKQEIWETFQEEHHEVLEQLPLSLQRSYSLITELDQQVNNYNVQMLSTFKEYVALRKTMALLSEPAVSAPEEPMQVDPTPDDASAEPTINGKDKHADDAPPRPARPTRELLSSIAQMADETVRSSREKLNLARFACGLVDRYIRDLDRAVKEQEAAISIGMRPGTHPAHIILPEVVAPGLRAPKSLQSSLLEELEEEEEEEQEPIEPVVEAPPEVIPPPEEPVPVVAEPPEPPPAPTPPPPPPPPPPPARRGRSKAKRKSEPPPAPLEQQLPTELVDAAVDQNIPLVPTTSHRPSVRLTPSLSLIPPVPPPPPPPPPPVPAEELPLDVAEDEKLYCICQKPSEGLMIACDNDGCPYEWYHAPCVNILRVPKGKWICEVCKAARKANPPPRGKPHRKKR